MRAVRVSRRFCPNIKNMLVIKGRNINVGPVMNPTAPLSFPPSEPITYLCTPCARMGLFQVSSKTLKSLPPYPPCPPLSALPASAAVPASLPTKLPSPHAQPAAALLDHAPVQSNNGCCCECKGTFLINLPRASRWSKTEAGAGAEITCLYPRANYRDADFAKAGQNCAPKVMPYDNHVSAKQLQNSSIPTAQVITCASHGHAASPLA